MPFFALTAMEITDYYVCVKICCAWCQVSAKAFPQEIVPKWWSRKGWECEKNLVASLGLMKSDKSSIITCKKRVMPCGTTCADTSIIRKKKKKNGAIVSVRCFDFLWYSTCLSPSQENQWWRDKKKKKRRRNTRIEECRHQHNS